MKKQLLFFCFVAAIIVFAGAAFAGNPPKPKKAKKWVDNDSLYIFNRHKKIFYLGYGVGIPANYPTLYDFTSSSITKTGPVYFKFERAIKPKLGIGINFYWLHEAWNTSYENDVPRVPVIYNRNYIRNSYGALARFNYHQRVNRKFDGYIGGGVGYGKVVWQRSGAIPPNYDDTPPSSPPMVFEATIGGRYLLGPHWLAYFEAGYSRSIFQVGISFNIPKP